MWKRPQGMAMAVVLAAAIASTAPPSLADSCEFDHAASAGDPDYAAGKQAMEKKDWREAVRHFNQAVLRARDNADLYHFLGFSYRSLGQLDLALRYYGRALARISHTEQERSAIRHEIARDDARMTVVDVVVRPFEALRC